MDNTAATVTFDTTAPVFANAAIRGTDGQDGWTNSGTGVIYTVEFTEAASTSGLHSFTMAGFDTVTAATLGGTDIFSYKDAGSVFTLPANAPVNTTGTGVTLTITGTVPAGATAEVKIGAASDRAGNAAAASGGTVDSTAATVTFDTTAPVFTADSATLTGSAAARPGYYSALTGVLYRAAFTEGGSGLYRITVSGFESDSLANFKLNNADIAGASSSGLVITFPEGVTGGTLSFTGTVPSGGSATVNITGITDRAGNTVSSPANSSAVATQDTTSPDIAIGAVVVDGTATDVENFSTGKVVWRFQFTEEGSGINALTLNGDVFSGSEIKYLVSGNTGEYDTASYSYLTGTYDSGIITLGSNWHTGSGRYLYIAGLLKDPADAGTPTLSLASFTDGAGNTVTGSDAEKIVTVDLTGPEIAAGNGGTLDSATGEISGITVTDGGSGFNAALGSGKYSVTVSPDVAGATVTGDGSALTVGGGAAVPASDSSASYTYTLTLIDNTGTSRTWTRGMTATDSGGIVTYADTTEWEEGTNTVPSVTLNMASPFMASPYTSGPSSDSGRINSYYSALMLNADARGGGTGSGTYGLPVSYTRNGRTPARDGGRSRIVYTGASTAAGLRELYRDLVLSPRPGVVLSENPVYDTGEPRNGNRESVNVQRNPGDRRNAGGGQDHGMGNAGRSAVADAGNAGDPVNVNGGAGGGNAAAPGPAVSFPQAMALLPPLAGDSGEGVPSRDRDGNGIGERSFLNPQLRPWNHRRKAGARRRSRYWK